MTLNVGALHRISLALVAVFGSLGVMSGSTLLLIAGLVLIAVVLGGARTIHRRQKSRSRAVIVHGLTVAGLVFAGLVFRTVRVDAVFLVVMLGIFNRWLMRAGHRDDLIVIGAASVLMAAATTVTPGLGFLLLFMGFIPATAWALWTSMLLGMVEAGSPGAGYPMLERPVPPRLARLAMSALALSLFGYITVSLLPRYHFSTMLSAGGLMAMPGASDSMQVRTGGLTDRGDDTVVLRVSPGPNVPQRTLDDLYARLYALDRFDGREWTSSKAGHLSFYSKPPVDTGAGTIEVTLERIEQRYHHPVALIGRDRPWTVTTSGVHSDLSGTTVIDGFRTRALTYQALVGVPSPMPRLPSVMKRTSDELLVALPESLDPRIVELGRRLTSSLPDPQQKIEAVLRHFRTGFRYSLERLAGEAKDPLARFLFEAKQGHCELYASAVAVLLRAAGFKARVATGYYSGKWNEMGGYQMFAQEDAHAWTEVLVEGEGWIWVDATPPDARSRRAASTWATIQELYDALSAVWYDNVVDYDAEKQRSFFEALSKRLDDIGKGAAGDGAKGSDPTAAKPQGSAWVARVVGPILIVAIVAIAVLALRARRDPKALGKRLRRALGQRPKENATLGMLLTRVPEPARADAQRAIALYESLRFGSAGDPGEVGASIVKLERTLKADKAEQKAKKRAA